MSNESQEADVRKTVVESPRTSSPAVTARPARPASSERPEPGEDKASRAQMARPMFRPPMAVLWVFDDGGETAEQVRIRVSSFVIGRTQGDFTVPHDNQISSRHAEIVRDFQNGQCRWLLRDLNSRNGTFVRVRAAVLKDDAQVMLGRRRFRFVPAPPPAEAPEAAEADIRHTFSWKAAPTEAAPQGFPALVELLAAGEGRRLPLTQDTQVIGRDRQQCDLAVPEDPTLSPQHARIYRDAQDRWHVENIGAGNDLWLRVTEIPLTSQGCFMLGEQVFALAIP